MKPKHSFIVDRVSAHLWREILHLAEELDLEKGGYWDARSGCLNLWAGPEDRPAGWPDEVPITNGALTFPRSFVASFHLEWPGDRAETDLPEKLPVALEICCYDVAEWQRRYPHQGGPDPREMGRARRADLGVARVGGDFAWCRRHWRALRDRALDLAPKLPRLGPVRSAPGHHCPRCGEALVHLLRPPAELASWRFSCQRCRTLTVSAEELPGLLTSLPEGALGVVGAIPLPTRAGR